MEGYWINVRVLGAADYVEKYWANGYPLYGNWIKKCNIEVCKWAYFNVVFLIPI